MMIKQFLLFLLIVVFNLNHTNAQGVELGAKVGTDIQKIAGASFSDRFAFGYHYGAYAQLKITSSFGFQPELYFSTVDLDTAKGFSAIYGRINSGKLRFGYINLPLLVNFRYNKFMSIQLGPKFSMLTDKNNAIFGNRNNIIKTGEMSGIIGVQANILRFRFYGRYQFGLSDLNNVSDAFSSVASKERWKNQVIHLGVGLCLL